MLAPLDYQSPMEIFPGAIFRYRPCAAGAPVAYLRADLMAVPSTLRENASAYAIHTWTRVCACTSTPVMSKDLTCFPFLSGFASCQRNPNQNTLQSAVWDPVLRCQHVPRLSLSACRRNLTGFFSMAPSCVEPWRAAPKQSHTKLQRYKTCGMDYNFRRCASGVPAWSKD